MRRATILGVLIGGTLATASPVSAATVQFVPGTEESFALVLFEAGAGEANDLKITGAPGAAGPIVFHDAGASVTAGPGCVAVDRNTASCEWPHGYFQLFIRLGDLDDSASEAVCPSCEVGWPQANILGGQGNDILVGTRSHLALYGGDGDDVLRGGLDGDYLQGGSGADQIDGGAEEFPDVLSYAGHRVGVTVDLDEDPIEGAPGENDMVVNVESVTGGAGDDRLVGDGGYNELSGGPGRDVLLGRGSGDWLSGGSQADVIRAGSGRDLVAGDGGDDWLEGGPGADWIGGDASVNRGGDDTVIGGPGSDSLLGFGGADRLFGGDGGDAIYGHGGRDLLDGGRGRDLLDGDTADPSVVDRVRGGPDRDEASVDWRDMVSGVEEIHRRGKPPRLAGRAPPTSSVALVP